MADTTKAENRIAGDEGFKNRTLLITGGTGFLGKVLIEKILRTCPLVEKIYVIVRPKKGKDPQTRINQMFEDPLFDLLTKMRSEEILKKVVAVPGDISKENLGLPDVYRKLVTKDVQIIYHMAALTRFDLSFKNAVMANTISTREVIRIAKECRKLLVLVHVSTAYCFPQERILYEKMYSLPLNPVDIIKVVETMEEEVIETIGKKYMSEYPNTYTFSKALAEMIVNDEMNNLPLIIARPSIVIPVIQDPIPGWTDNLNGLVGFAVAAGKGILRSMYCNSSTYADFLPVDMTANLLLAVAYDYMTNKSRKIYNLTSSSEVKITWNEIIELGIKINRTTMPYNWIIWYPGVSMTSSRFVHKVCVVLFHYIPAIILDALIILTANKPIMWKMQQKLTKSLHLIEYYTNHQWDFNSAHVLEVRKLMNRTEKEIYYRVEPRSVDIERYLYDINHGARLYILKEGDETLPTARRHTKIMWALDKLLRILIWIGIGYLLIQFYINIMNYE